MARRNRAPERAGVAERAAQNHETGPAVDLASLVDRHLTELLAEDERNRMAGYSYGDAERDVVSDLLCDAARDLGSNELGGDRVLVLSVEGDNVVGRTVPASELPT